MPKLPNGNKGDSNQGALNCESCILPLSHGASRLVIFPDHQSCLCSFGIHFLFLCESNQLLFFGVVTSDVNLASCDDIVFEPSVQTFVNHSVYQCSET